MVTNKTIKDEIKKAIEGMEQWSDMGLPEYIYKYSVRLKTLVELLEVDNCGSVGGYDKGQNIKGNHYSADNLINRAKWVLSK